MADRRQITVSRPDLDGLINQSVQRDSVSTPYRLEVTEAFFPLEDYLVHQMKVMSRIEVGAGRNKRTFSLSDLRINPMFKKEYLAVTALVSVVSGMTQHNRETNNRRIQEITIVSLARRGEVFDIQPRIDISQRTLSAVSFLSRYRGVGNPVKVAYTNRHNARGQAIVTTIGLGYSDPTTGATVPIIKFAIRATY